MENKKIYTYEEAKKLCLEYFKGEELSATVFLDKYALKDRDQNLLEATPDEMFDRLSSELYRIEKKKFKNPLTKEEIYEYIKGFNRIVLQGSPMAGIGNDYQYTTVSNCFVIDSPLDSYSSICRTDEEIVSVSKRRGGLGLDLSNLRPAGSLTTNAARSSTGVITFAERYSNTIREVGQCLYKDTLILTEGGLKKISDVKSGDKVWTQQEWVEVKKVIQNKKSCLKIKTQSGKEIICSKEHTFHTVNGEKKAENFIEGDLITQVVGKGWEGADIPLYYDQYNKNEYANHSNRLKENYTLPSTLDEKLAYILGYSYGDGYVGIHRNNGKKNSLSLSCSDAWEDIKIKLKDYIKNVFNCNIYIKEHKEACADYIIHSRLILDFLEKNNILKQKALDLIFPQILLSANKNIIFSFLSGFFDADGSVVKSKKVYKITSISENFILMIQNILSSYGIISRIHKMKRENIKWHDIYTLVINGQKSQNIFRELMSESIKIQTVLFNKKTRDWSRTTCKVGDFNSTASKHSYLINDDQYISYSVSDRLNEDLNSNKVIYLLQDKVYSISIYDNNKEQDVYDLCLEKEHLFFANGLYAHNSGRRGALLLSLSVHHPEIVEFASCKKDLNKVTGANISIRLTDEFLNAVKNNTEYEQRFPVECKNVEEKKISKMVNARSVWNKIIENARNYAEPGLLFFDRIISESPADCYSKLGFASISTNPCGELPLAKYSACILAVLNLFSYVKNPFTKDAYFDFEFFKADAKIAQRFMDNIVDIELEKIEAIIKKIKSDPEPEDIKRNELEVWKKMKVKCFQGRRTGTGLTALGDTFAALGIKYGSQESIEAVKNIYKTMKLSCYRSSVEMAKELGPFEIWDYELEKNNPFLLRIKDEDPELYEDMKKYGRRNIALLTSAPAGSVSIETQTTSGIEPLFQISHTRKKKINPNDKSTRVDSVDQNGDSWQHFEIFHPKVKMWMEVNGEKDIKKSPWYGCCAEEINWENRVRLQATANQDIDHSISSTINLPEDVSVQEVAKIYETAWTSGCKGVTIYRKNSRTGVLVDNKENKKEKITKTKAPKRPVILPAEIYYVTSKGEPYFIIVGLLGEDPYEVFAGKEKGIFKKISIKKGLVKKISRGRYSLLEENGELVVEDICKKIDEDQEAITRLISASLRHGCDASFIVHQLEKVEGDMLSFAKALSRVMKKYIADGVAVHGETCIQCGGNNLKRSDGCRICCDCGHSRC